MARQTPGNYVPLDVNYARDIAVRKAGTNAELLYIRSLAYAKGARTSGFVSDFDLEVVAVGMRAVKAAAQKLCEVGLWVRVEDGWLIRSWDRWNAADRIVSAGGKLGNHKRWHIDRGETDPECEHCTDRTPIAPRSHPVSPPISPPESQGKGREGKGSTASASPLRIVEDDPKNAGQIVSLWIDSLERRPPSAVVGQIAKQVKALLEDKFSEQEIVDGLNAWQAKNLHPSTLPSVVNETINKPKEPRKKQAEVAPGRWQDCQADGSYMGMKTRWV